MQRNDHEKKILFHYLNYIMPSSLWARQKNTISHLINTLTTLWSYYTTSFYNYLLRSLRPTKLFKKSQTLSSLFLGNFAGVLHYLLPILSAGFFMQVEYNNSHLIVYHYEGDMVVC